MFSHSGKKCPRTNQADGHVGRLFQRHGPSVAKARSSVRELLLIKTHLSQCGYASFVSLNIQGAAKLGYLRIS